MVVVLGGAVVVVAVFVVVVLFVDDEAGEVIVDGDGDAILFTSLALIIPISLAGSATNFSLGRINWTVFWACAIAGAVGAVLGSLFIQKIPPLYAKRAFAVFLLYAATRLWMK